MAMRATMLAVLAMLAAGQAAADTRDGRDAFRRADFATALKALEPEARKGNAEAITYLAKMYQAGLGVDKDVPRAVEMFGRAAEAGNAEAQHSYGIALALGEGGIEQNIVEGLKWLNIAAMAGHSEARSQITKLSTTMPREVVSQARRAAFEWNAARSKKDDAGAAPSGGAGAPPKAE